MLNGCLSILFFCLLEWMISSVNLRSLRNCKMKSKKQNKKLKFWSLIRTENAKGTFGKPCFPIVRIPEYLCINEDGFVIFALGFVSIGWERVLLSVFQYRDHLKTRTSIFTTVVLNESHQAFRIALVFVHLLHSDHTILTYSSAVWPRQLYFKLCNDKHITELLDGRVCEALCMGLSKAQNLHGASLKSIQVREAKMLIQTFSASLWNPWKWRFNELEIVAPFSCAF